MAITSPNAVEIHFAVSDAVSVYLGKDSVTHVGFSIGPVSYNCGRTEGRFSSNLTDHGPFAAVRSPYRADGFYLRIADNAGVARALSEYVDTYLASVPRTLSTEMVENLWFVKVLGGLADIGELKALHNVNFETYQRMVRAEHPLLADVDFEEFEAFCKAKEADELSILKHAYPFFGGMSLAQYRTLRQMEEGALRELAALAASLKADLSNRMYDTFWLSGPDFNSGKYQMIKGENCVKASMFFLERGLTHALSALEDDPVARGQAGTALKLVARLQKNNRLRMPWRAFRNARRHSAKYKGAAFVDTPDDGVYWGIFGDDAELTDSKKKKELSLSGRKKRVAALLKKTDSVAYEKQGLEYVDWGKLTTQMKQKCARLKDLIPLGTGGGNRTRFLA